MKIRQKRNDLIDLGRVSLDTRGGPQGMDDHQAGLYRFPGLCLD